MKYCIVEEWDYDYETGYNVIPLIFDSNEDTLNRCEYLCELEYDNFLNWINNHTTSCEEIPYEEIIYKSPSGCKLEYNHMYYNVYIVELSEFSKEL